MKFQTKNVSMVNPGQTGIWPKTVTGLFLMAEPLRKLCSESAIGVANWKRPVKGICAHAKYFFHYYKTDAHPWKGKLGWKISDLISIFISRQQVRGFRTPTSGFWKLGKAKGDLCLPTTQSTSPWTAMCYCQKNQSRTSRMKERSSQFTNFGQIRPK